MVMDVLFYPFAWFMEWPYLTAIPALIFGLAHLGFRRGSAGLERIIMVGVAGLWIIYGIYEWRMRIWSQTVQNPIRIDLLLIAPLLYIATGVGLVALVIGFARRRQQWGSSNRD
jgi:hypothetical protein